MSAFIVLVSDSRLAFVLSTTISLSYDNQLTTPGIGKIVHSRSVVDRIPITNSEHAITKQPVLPSKEQPNVVECIVHCDERGSHIESRRIRLEVIVGAGPATWPRDIGSGRTVLHLWPRGARTSWRIGSRAGKRAGDCRRPIGCTRARQCSRYPTMPRESRRHCPSVLHFRSS